MRMTKHVRGTKGARLVGRSAVMQVRAPEATPTWRPVTHNHLLTLVEKRLEGLQLEVQDSQHYLGKDGAQYFGRLHVQPVDKTIERPGDYGFFVGLRNSINKTLAGTLGFGTNVFVCDNGMFSAEYILNRKHTPEIVNDLPRLIDITLNRLVGHQDTIRHRFDTYKQVEVGDREAHDLIIRAAETGGTNYRQVPTVVEQWHRPNHPEFAEHKNAWRLLNAFTEAAKLGSEADLWDRSLTLQEMLDTHCRFTGPDREVITSSTVEEVAQLS